MRSTFAVAIVLGLFGHAAGAADVFPFRDPQRPVDERVQDLIGRLTLEEKALLLDHKGPTLERFHIRSDQWNQCLNGVKWDRPTTLFPICLGMAATWDTNLIHDVASALSDEARAIYNGWHLDPNAKGEHKGLIYRAPVINIGRNPYWGRNHEAFGEDPFLCGRMTVAYVRGLQGDDPKYLKIAATLKHFAVNNVETDRQKLNAVVSERMLREYWLPHFRDGVVEGGAQSLMASYNAINGTPNNINHWLLTDLLKKEWKHEGFVVSDLGGVRTMVTGHGQGKMTFEDAVAQSVMAGCDFSDKEYAANIPAGVRNGKITPERLDDAVRRVLRVRFRLGEFDPFDTVPFSKIAPTAVDSAAHRALALKTAKASVVLLQNREQLLPLDKTKLARVAVIGPQAERTLWNNYNGALPACVTPLQGLKDRLPPTCAVVSTLGAVVSAKPHPWIKEEAPKVADADAEIGKAVELARSADVAILFIGTDSSIEHEARDRRTLALPGRQEDLVKAVLAANPKTVVVLMSAGPLAVPWLKEHVPALLQAWWPGEEGGHAMADVLLGDVNPAGRLPHTVYASNAQVPPQDEYDIGKGFTYMYVKGEPLFPFGHGLGYTTFAYTNLRISSSLTPPITVQVDIENTGTRPGDEVVQLYTHAQGQAVARPAKELKGFSRIALKPGEKRTIAFAIPADRLGYWSEKEHRFVVEACDYDVLVGASSADIRLQGKATLK